MKTKFLLPIAFAAATMAAWAQTPYENPPFGVGARMSALAESNVSEARDVSGMYWNPASLTLFDYNTIFAAHQFTHDLTDDIGAVSINIDQYDAVGVGGLVTQFPSVPVRAGTSSFPTQYGVDFGYSHKFSYALSFGLRLSARYGQMEGMNSITTGFGGVGIIYAPTPTFSYGAVYNGIGAGLTYANDKSPNEFREEHLPGSLEIGVAMHYPSDQKDPALTMTISNEKIITDHDMRYKFGIEAVPIPYFTFRAGYYVEPTSSRPTFGAGLRFGLFSVDYAYVPHKYDTELHQFSATIGF